MRKSVPAFILLLALFTQACQNSNVQQSEAQKPAEDEPTAQAESSYSFSADNGSISLPDGFKAVVVADEIGAARHLAIRENGDVYVNLGSPKNGSGVVALRDQDGDGVSDTSVYFGRGGGTGIRLHNGYLYYSTDTEVLRHKLKENELLPSAKEELVLTLPSQNQHAAKPLAFDGAGNMYVTIGAPSNACQDPSRTKGVKGQDPCPLLESSGGIWQFSADKLNQKFEDGKRYATGIRHAVAISWSDQYDQLFAMQHGRDQLHQFWPEHFSEKESAELPAEEFLAIEDGDDFGWPYCYYDHRAKQKYLNPEYGGDGSKVERCAEVKKPLLGFPGHWAPNGLEFSNNKSFPTAYADGAFIAFHGSWNRAPFPQQGYKVMFVPFENGAPAGGSKVFADEFAADGSEIEAPREAEYRPCGLAMGPDGSLYICDDASGRIWRVIYTAG